MIQLLRGFGESEINETDVAMQWMDEPVPLDRMPGMATADDIDALRRCTDDCDEIFVQLMTTHHEGGAPHGRARRDALPRTTRSA